MYERFHRLRERPFSLSPDPDYLYPSRVHKEALSYLRYGIEGHAGFIVITGEVGSGKTTLLQTALRTLDRQTSVARLVNTMLDARDLLEAIMLDFGLDPGEGRSKPHLLRDLARYLVDQRSAGRLSLLVIDEAQNLSFAALEEVRMLSNLETEKSKLIQIALIGQPNLRDVMGRPELEQLRQRVTVSYHLQALDAADTDAYINHRLRRAAIGAPLEFPPEVTRLIHEHSQGIPRKINVISDAVLLFAYGDDQHTITESLTREVLAELEGSNVISKPSSTDSTSSTPPSPPPAQTQPLGRSLTGPIADTTSSKLADGQLLSDRTDIMRGERPPIDVVDRFVLTSPLSQPPATPQVQSPSSTVVQAAASPNADALPSFTPPRSSANSAAMRPTPQTAYRPPAAGPRIRTAVPVSPLRSGTYRSPTPAISREVATNVLGRESNSFWARVRRSLFSPKPAFED